MEKGFNTDINVKGAHYHVQTEDWGSENPFFVSHVFREGAVVRRIKTSYQSVLPDGASSDTAAIRLALKLQHEQILDLLLSGKL